MRPVSHTRVVRPSSARRIVMVPSREQRAIWLPSCDSAMLVTQSLPMHGCGSFAKAVGVAPASALMALSQLRHRVGSAPADAGVRILASVVSPSDGRTGSIARGLLCGARVHRERERDGINDLRLESTAQARSDA